MTLSKVETRHPCTSDTLVLGWQDIKDFRNLLAHEYFGDDLEIVWNTIHDDLPMLMDAVQEMVKGIK